MARNNLSRLFVSAEETKQKEEVSINGEFPKWLNGTFYQTGPGLVDLPNFTMNDYLDGYAILTKFEIGGPTVKLTKKYPETESYRKALELGKPYFNEYGTTAKREGSKSGLWSKLVTTLSRDDMSDNCSASIYQLGGSIIAASAASFISKINAVSLCHEQRYDAKKYLGQNGYGVHPLIDDEGTMWNVGFSVLPTVKYNIIKIPRATSTEVETDKILSKGSTIVSISPRWSGALSLNHSFGMTKNYIIFLEQPYVIKISRVLAATLKDYAVKEWLEWRGSEKNKFYIIEKSTGKVHVTEYLSSESFFFLHFINCYEEDNNIIVDIATAKTPSSTDATCLQNLRNKMIEEADPWIIERFIIPLMDSVKSVTENCNLLRSSATSLKTTAQAMRKGSSIILTPEILFKRGADRAIINPSRLSKKHSIIYISGSFLSLTDPDNRIMANSICKLNTETKETKMWTASENHFPGESVFIPRSNAEDADEDDGAIICAASSSTETAKDCLVVLDGKSFKEMGTAEFKNQIPIGMHGMFVPHQ